MTSEPPPPPARRNRPDTAFRRRALGLPGAASPTPTAPARESFRSALSRIPDLDRSEADPAPVDAGAPPAAGRPARPDDDPLGAPPGPAEPEPQDPDGRLEELPVTGGRRTSAPPPAPWWRRAAFAGSLVALIVAIPILGRTGYRLVTASTDGKVATGGVRPGEPNYEELVTSSPTALVIHKDATTGQPVNLTFLSLAGATGGTVIFIPLDTEVVQIGFGIDRLRTAYSMVSEAPVDEINAQLTSQTAAIMNVGIEQIIELDDSAWDRLVAPVAPLGLENSDSLVLNGASLPTGPVRLTPDLVGPYLASAREGEDDNNRFFRQEQLWRSWLAAVAGSTRADAVPGETTTGIGLFARRLAQGPVTYATLPGTFEGEGSSLLYDPDEDAIGKLIADAVPAPTAAYPGSRVAVRLLNGVAPADIPTAITKRVVALDGTVHVVGNGPAFGTAKTDVVYGDPAQKAYAELLRAGLGATGTVRQDPAAPDNIGVTVILGKDLLGDQVATTTTTPGGGAPIFTSSTTTTAPGGP